MDANNENESHLNKLNEKMDGLKNENDALQKDKESQSSDNGGITE